MQVKHLVDDATRPEQFDASVCRERQQPLDQLILFEPCAIENVGVESDEQEADLIGGMVAALQPASGTDAEELRFARSQNGFDPDAVSSTSLRAVERLVGSGDERSDESWGTVVAPPMLIVTTAFDAEDRCAMQSFPIARRTR